EARRVRGARQWGRRHHAGTGDPRRRYLRTDPQADRRGRGYRDPGAGGGNRQGRSWTAGREPRQGRGQLSDPGRDRSRPSRRRGSGRIVLNPPNVIPGERSETRDPSITKHRPECEERWVPDSLAALGFRDDGECLGALTSRAQRTIYCGELTAPKQARPESPMFIQT